MKKIRLFLLVLLFLAACSDAAFSALLITEVMVEPSDDNNEFVEIYNSGPASVDLANHWLTDGDEIDQIVTWDANGTGPIAGMTTNTLIVPANSYALILDSQYTIAGGYTTIPAGTILLTVDDADIGSALTDTDPVTIVSSYAIPPQIGPVVATYGTPALGDTTNFTNLDDDGLDSIPLDPGSADLSIERRTLTDGDVQTNWAKSVSNSTPGKVNSINGTGPNPAIHINEVLLKHSDSGKQWVELVNTSASSVLMTGWVITDNDSNVFTFPTFTLNANSYVTVHFEDPASPPQNNTATDLYHGSGGFFTTTTDQIALYWSSSLNNDTIADFLAYRLSSSSTYVNDADDDHAAAAGIWTDGAYYDAENYGDNNSIGLKVSGQDSNALTDWAVYSMPSQGSINLAEIPDNALIINEVAFNGGGGTVTGSTTGELTEDWIEVKNVSANPINLKGLSFYETSTTTSPKVISVDTTIAAGKFLLLHFDKASPDESDGTGDTEINGIIDTYWDDTGLTGTNAQIFMKGPTGKILDACVWGNSTLTTLTTIEFLQSKNAWTDNAPSGGDFNDVVPEESVGTGQTIARDSSNKDTNAKTDWLVVPNPTPGRDTPAPFTATIVINEVAFSSGGGNFGGTDLTEDWVELFCVNDGNNGAGVDISGLYFEDDSPFKTIAPGTRIETGEYILLYCDSSTIDEIASGSDDVIRIYTTHSGLTGTDDQLILKDPFGSVVDAVCWADQSGAFSSGEQEDVAAIVDAGQWTGSNESDCVPSNSVGSKDSIARDASHSDTNARADWTIRSTSTPGADNGAPPEVDHFDIIAPAYAQSGTAFTVIVKAINESNELIETYSGTPILTATNTATVIPANLSGFISGIANANITLTASVGTNTEITISENGKNGKTGNILITSTLPSPTILVNEAAFKGGGSGYENDWIELYCKDDGMNGLGVNIRSWNLDDLESAKDKYFNDCTVKTGEYILVHYNNTDGTEDESSLQTGKKAINVYTTDAGLTDTDEQIALANSTDTVVDALCWVEGDTISSTEIAPIQTLANNNQWTIAGAAPAASDCVNSGTDNIASKQSLARDGISTDTNAKADWTPSTVPTPGESNANGPQEDVVLLISEVAFKGGGGTISGSTSALTNDWVEIYCVDDKNSGAGANITGYYIQDDSRIKTFEAGTTIRTGEYILLEFNSSSSDESSAQDNIIHIYTSDSGMTTTDENLIVCNHLGKMVDAVIWSDQSGSFSDTEVEDMQEMITAGQWTGSAQESDAVDTSSIADNQSIARDRSFADTNSKSDWTVRSLASPGNVNAQSGEPVSTVVLPEGTVKGLVGMEIEITIEGHDIADAITTTADFFVNLTSNSSTTKFSGDSGYTWSSTLRARVLYGKVLVQIKESSAGTILVNIEPEDSRINSSSKSITFNSVPDVVVNEIMYNTDEIQGDSTDGEWIEIYNRSGGAIDISNWKVTIAGTNTYIPQGTILNTDSYLVIANDLIDDDGDGVCFARLYGDKNGVWDPVLDGFNVIDAKNFSLSDTAGEISIVTSPNSVTLTFNYDDGWGGDGDGSSLEKKDPNVNDRNSLAVDAYNWSASTPKDSHGTPGKKNTQFTGNLSSLVITHTPVETGYLGQQINIEALVTSNLAMNSVKIYFRKKGSNDDFTSLDMTNLTGTHVYKASIPSNHVSLDGIEYYVKAIDSGGTDSTSPANLVQDHAYEITVTDILPKLKIIVPDKGISMDELFYTDIRLENVTDCYGVTFELTYPKDILEVQDQDKNRPGDQLAVGNFMISGFNEVNEADKSLGIIKFSIKGLEDEVSGSGVIATIQFKNKSTAIAEYDLVFQNSLVEDKSHTALTPAYFNGKIKIGSGSSDLVGSEGGLISGPSEMQLRIPEGAFSFPTRITIDKLPKAQLPDMTPLEAQTEIQPIYTGFKIAPENLETSRTIELVYTYSSSEIEAVGLESGDEKYLAIYWWNDSELSWQKLGGKVDSGGNNVVGKITKFGIYTLVKDTQVSDSFRIDNLRITPNPFSPNGNNIKDKTVITYELTGDADVYLRVFNIKGEEVKRLIDGDEITGGTDTREWDGKDDWGEILPTGIYIIHVHATEDGDLKRFAKAKATVVISKNMFE